MARFTVFSREEGANSQCSTELRPGSNYPAKDQQNKVGFSLEMENYSIKKTFRFKIIHDFHVISFVDYIPVKYRFIQAHVMVLPICFSIVQRSRTREHMYVCRL